MPHQKKMLTSKKDLDQKLERETTARNFLYNKILLLQVKIRLT